MEIIANVKQLFDSAASLHRKLVFWYDNDPERELEPIREDLTEIGVQVWELTPYNLFATKHHLELVAPDQSYLIYSRHPKPETLQNWMLDILLYSEEFSADDIALTMHRLRVDQLAVREFFEQHRVFFRNAERVSRLERVLPSSPTQGQLILGMFTVLTGSDTLQLSAIVRDILLQGLDPETNKPYQNIEKFFDLKLFWEHVYSLFGIKHQDEPTLSHLFQSLVYNHFVVELDFDLPNQWSDRFAALQSTLPNTCRIFIEDWKHAASAECAILEGYLAELEVEWDIRELLIEQPYTEYQRCDTFRVTEELYVQRLTEELEQDTASAERWQELLSVRRTKHWYACEPYVGSYRALEAALSLTQVQYQVQILHAPISGQEWVKLYTQHLYQVDRLYRVFMTAIFASHIPERLQPLREKIENWYSHHYLVQVANWTDRLLNDGMLENWSLYQVLQQRNFYQEMITPHLHSTTERIFVIISDAFRYEAGTELAVRLQQRLNSEVTITPMQGTLPSYTQLGMASLLPGRKLAFQGKQVFLNGMSTQGLLNREAILQKREPRSRAMRLQDFIVLKSEEGQAEIRNQRVVYLYHDEIDATGDSQKSEHNTFRAVEETLKTLEGAVDKLVRTYSAVRIYITSDHGFLFQTGAVQAFDKTVAVTGDIIDSNRRFAIGRHLSVPDGARRLSLRYLELEEEAVIATGLNRFQTSGGARFVHGGAMPQETLIPVISYRQIRGQARKTEQPYVDVRLTNRERVITQHRFKAVFFQEQKVEDKRLPRHLRLAVYYGEERISNEVTLVFDSREEPSHRNQEIIFSLQEQSYPPGERCILRMEDVSTSQTVLYREEELDLRLYETY